MPDDQPWRDAAPAPPRPSDAASRRYARAARLTQFAGELRRWERLGTTPTPRMRAKVAYRRACLARWQDYLDGWTPPSPQGGRRPRGGAAAG